MRMVEDIVRKMETYSTITDKEQCLRDYLYELLAEIETGSNYYMEVADIKHTCDSRRVVINHINWKRLKQKLG
jgi:hypothetical protein